MDNSTKASKRNKKVTKNVDKSIKANKRNEKVTKGVDKSTKANKRNRKIIKNIENIDTREIHDLNEKSKRDIYKYMIIDGICDNCKYYQRHCDLLHCKQCPDCKHFRDCNLLQCEHCADYKRDKRCQKCEDAVTVAIVSVLMPLIISYRLGKLIYHVTKYKILHLDYPPLGGREWKKECKRMQKEGEGNLEENS